MVRQGRRKSAAEKVASHAGWELLAGVAHLEKVSDHEWIPACSWPAHPDVVRKGDDDQKLIDQAWDHSNPKRGEN